MTVVVPSIDNDSFSNFKLIIKSDFETFLLNADPVTHRAIVIAIGSSFVEDVLRPFEVQSLVLDLPLELLRGRVASIYSESDFRMRGSILNMNLDALQNQVRNLSQLEVIKMTREIILLPEKELREIFRSINASDLKDFIISLDKEQKRMILTFILRLSESQLSSIIKSIPPLLYRITVSENFVYGKNWQVGIY